MSETPDSLPAAASRASGRPPITGLILAGGAGTRMHGADKGLELLQGKPLAAWALERLAPQVGEVLINANRNLSRYAALGPRVVPDVIGDHAGPLAGLHRGLMEAAHELVATVPCDAPFFPLDLVERLASALRDAGADLAFARAGGANQPVFCLARVRLLPPLTAFIEEGGRKVDAWFATLRAIGVDFADNAAFANLNTADDLRRAGLGQAPASRR